MSVEIIAENNRLIRELLFAKKLIKCLENIMHFAVNMKTTCGCDHIRTLVHTNDHHFQDYQRLKHECTAAAASTPIPSDSGRSIGHTVEDRRRPKTTRVANVCHECTGDDRDIDDLTAADHPLDGHQITGICVGRTAVKCVTKSDFYRYQQFLKPLTKSVSTNTVNQTPVTVAAAGVAGIQCNCCGHQTLTAEEMYAHQRHIHRAQRIDDCLINYECSDRQCGFKCPDQSSWFDHKLQHERCDRTVVFNKRQNTSTARPLSDPIVMDRHSQPMAPQTNELSLAISSISSASDGTVVVNAVPIRSNDQPLMAYPTAANAGTAEVFYRTYELKNFNPLKCTHCSYGIKRDNETNGLMRAHMCGQHPNHSSDFDKSLAAKEANTAYVFECIECQRILEDQVVLDLHHQTVHSGVTAYRLWCDLCSYTTDSYQEFIQHNSRHRTRVQKIGHNTAAREVVSESVATVVVTEADGDEEVDEDHDMTESVTAEEEEGLEATAETETIGDQLVIKCMDRRYHCSQDDCHKSFKHEYLLIKHTRNHHKLIECDKCQTRYKSVQLLNAHLLKSHREYLIRCQSCDYQTFWPSFHDRHVTRHHMTQWWSCQHKNCAERFLKQQSLERHVNKAHKRGFRPYECPDDGCGAEYYTQGELIRHRGRAHRALVYECDQCEYRCCDTGSLAAHRNDRHLRHVYRCSAADCRFESRHSSVLNGHWNRCHSRRYACGHNGCGRVYATRALLTKHTARHPFPNVCDVGHCGRDFMSFKALAVHKWSAHNVPIRDRKHVCPHCHRVFSTKKGYGHHLKTKHQRRPAAAVVAVTQ